MFLVSDGNEYKALQLLKGWPYCFCVSVIDEGFSITKMAYEKKPVSSFTVKFGLVLLAGCILVPISLATMFRHCSVPLQTCKFLR